MNVYTFTIPTLRFLLYTRVVLGIMLSALILDVWSKELKLCYRETKRCAPVGYIFHKSHLQQFFSFTVFPFDIQMFHVVYYSLLLNVCLNFNAEDMLLLHYFCVAVCFWCALLNLCIGDILMVFCYWWWCCWYAMSMWLLVRVFLAFTPCL